MFSVVLVGRNYGNETNKEAFFYCEVLDRSFIIQVIQFYWAWWEHLSLQTFASEFLFQKQSSEEYKTRSASPMACATVFFTLLQEWRSWYSSYSFMNWLLSCRISVWLLRIASASRKKISCIRLPKYSCKSSIVRFNVPSCSEWAFSYMFLWAFAL